MTYTRDDCICPPLDPDPDCPYHVNREIEAFNVEQMEREERRRDDTRRLYADQAREELARSDKKQNSEQGSAD